MGRVVEALSPDYGFQVAGTVDIDNAAQPDSWPQADVAIVRHCIHGALDFVPFWFHPDGRFPAEELFERVADTVLLMLGVEPGRPAARNADARRSGAGSSAKPQRPAR